MLLIHLSIKVIECWMKVEVMHSKIPILDLQMRCGWLWRGWCGVEKITD